MPSHKVSLTNRGFKILSTDFTVDLITVIFLYSLLIGMALTSPIFLWYILSVIIISGFFYFLYRYKVGYIYILSYIYQLGLFLTLSPLFSLNWIPMLIALVIGFGILYFENPFRKIYFPFGLFLALLAFSISILIGFGKDAFMKSMNFPANPSHLLDSSIIGNYFFPTLNISGEFPTHTFSILELSGLFIILMIAPMFLRQFNIYLDFLLILGLYTLFSLYFAYDWKFYNNRTINLTCITYLILSAPGRNFGFSHLFSFISLVFTGAIWYLLFRGDYSIPPMTIVAMFFLIQSLLFVIVNENLYTKISLLKSLLRK